EACHLLPRRGPGFGPNKERQGEAGHHPGSTFLVGGEHHVLPPNGIVPSTALRSPMLLRGEQQVNASVYTRTGNTRGNPPAPGPPREDTTGLPRGASRSSSTGRSAHASGCHGLALWRVHALFYRGRKGKNSLFGDCRQRA